MTTRNIFSKFGGKLVKGIKKFFEGPPIKVDLEGEEWVE
jgi:hypothetical protein